MDCQNGLTPTVLNPRASPPSRASSPCPWDTHPDLLRLLPPPDVSDENGDEFDHEVEVYILRLLIQGEPEEGNSGLGATSSRHRVLPPPNGYCRTRPSSSGSMRTGLWIPFSSVSRRSIGLPALPSRLRFTALQDPRPPGEGPHTPAPRASGLHGDGFQASAFKP
jgi:hypothetical protein